MVNRSKKLSARLGEIMVLGGRREQVMYSWIVRERAAVDIPAQDNFGVQELEYTERCFLAGIPILLDGSGSALYRKTNPSGMEIDN